MLHREPFKTALTNMPNQVAALPKQIAGEKDPTPEETAQKIDMTSRSGDFPQIKGPGG